MGRHGVTLEQYAEKLKLPVSFLESLGHRTVEKFRTQVVEMPRYDREGTRVGTKFRIALTGPNRFHNPKGQPIGLYGLERLDLEAKEVWLVEGESDTDTASYHGLQVVGLSGAYWKEEWEEHVAHAETIYVVREPGEAGTNLIRKLARSLETDRVMVVSLEGYKDLAELHCTDPDTFLANIEEAKATAVPLAVVVAVQPDSGSVAAHLERTGSLAEEASEDEVIDWLRKLFEEARDPVVRAGLRQAAINELNHVDCISAPAKVVDPIIAESEASTDPADDLQGSGVHLQDPDPWDKPVVGIELLDRLREVLTRHLVLPPHADIAIALWIVFTHAHDAWLISVILVIISATKRCGKTTLLMLLSGLVPRPLPTSNITPAALFRTIEAYEPTLLIDEADTFFSRRDELRGIVNSGHRRDVAYVIRAAGDDHEPRQFRTWSPKAIAQIGRPPETVVDRSIVIVMHRRAPNEHVIPLRLDRVGNLEPLRSQAWRWAQDHLDDLRDADPEVPEHLGDREADNWRPLLAIADAVGGPWPALARDAALGLAGHEGDDTPVVQLLADIMSAFRRRGHGRIRSSDLLLELHKIPESPWSEWKGGQPLSDVQLARLLKPFGIGPKTLWFQLRDGSKKSLRGYELHAFQDVFRRYFPDDDPQDPQGA